MDPTLIELLEVDIQHSGHLFSRLLPHHAHPCPGRLRAGLGAQGRGSPGHYSAGSQERRPSLAAIHHDPEVSILSLLTFFCPAKHFSNVWYHIVPRHKFLIWSHTNPEMHALFFFLPRNSLIANPRVGTIDFSNVRPVSLDIEGFGDGYHDDDFVAHESDDGL